MDHIGCLSTFAAILKDSKKYRVFMPEECVVSFRISAYTARCMDTGYHFVEEGIEGEHTETFKEEVSTISEEDQLMYEAPKCIPFSSVQGCVDKDPDNIAIVSMKRGEDAT